MALSFFKRQKPEAPGQSPASPGERAEPQATAEYVLRECQAANAAFLAKPLLDQNQTRASVERALEQVQGVRDRCVAFSMDDPQAGMELADHFLQLALGKGDWSAAVGDLLTDAHAIASGEEIDHHHPSGVLGGTSFDATACYSK